MTALLLNTCKYCRALTAKNGPCEDCRKHFAGNRR